MKNFLLWVAIATCGHGLATAGPRKYTDKYDEHFRKYSKHYFGVAFDWRWFKAQAVAESGLNETAESWVKAKGLMQLMPDTFAEVQKRNPHFADINDPRWNIAAGIYYDRVLWRIWKTIAAVADRLNFTFGSYNAGMRTMQRAQEVAVKKGYDAKEWKSIVAVAPEVPRWRHRETLGYVSKISAMRDEVAK
jgi:membrane-bound lytic murein transglycosylase F